MEVQATAGPTEKKLPLCSEIDDPFTPCQSDSVESGAVAMMLAALGLLQIA
jgi:hypothetical protein